MMFCPERSDCLYVALQEDEGQTISFYEYLWYCLEVWWSVMQISHDMRSNREHKAHPTESANCHVKLTTRFLSYQQSSIDSRMRICIYAPSRFNTIPYYPLHHPSARDLKTKSSSSRSSSWQTVRNIIPPLTCQLQDVFYAWDIYNIRIPVLNTQTMSRTCTP